MTLNELSGLMKTTLVRDSMVIVQAEAEQFKEVSEILKHIHPKLQHYGITVLLMDATVSIVVVPEARRAIVLPEDIIRRARKNGET